MTKFLKIENKYGDVIRINPDFVVDYFYDKIYEITVIKMVNGTTIKTKMNIEQVDELFNI